jgi:hypothetical protein
MRPLGGRTAARAIMVLAGIIAVAGCGGGAGGGGKATATKVSAEPVTLTSLPKVCTGVGLSRAPAYAGSQGHQAVVMVPGDSTAATRSTASSPFKMTDFTDEFPQLRMAPVTGAELAVCADRIGWSATSTWCTFTLPAGRARMYAARYAVTIRAVNTAAVLASATLNGNDTTCPTYAYVNRADPRIYSMPSSLAFVELLRSYLTWNGVPPRPGTASASVSAGNGPRLRRGDVTVVAPAGADAQTMEVLRGYLAYWADWNQAVASGSTALDPLLAHATTSAAFAIQNVVEDDAKDGRTMRGPEVLTTAVRAQPDGTVAVDACNDITAQHVFVHGVDSGAHPERVSLTTLMARRGDEYVATMVTGSQTSRC